MLGHRIIKQFTDTKTFQKYCIRNFLKIGKQHIFRMTMVWLYKITPIQPSVYVTLAGPPCGFACEIKLKKS